MVKITKENIRMCNRNVRNVRNARHVGWSRIVWSTERVKSRLNGKSGCEKSRFSTQVITVHELHDCTLYYRTLVCSSRIFAHSLSWHDVS